MYDFIIVGAGLAGVSFASILERYNRSFCIISDNSQIASLVAGGVYNPLVLKRFTSVWKSKEQMDTLYLFYTAVEEKLSKKLLIHKDILRKFSSIEEQNNWFSASDKPLLSAYMSTEMVPEFNDSIPAPFGFGKVVKTGRLAVKEYLEESIKLWKEQGVFHQRRFNYDDLKIQQKCIDYQGVTAKNIVFCEGYGVIKNPLFNYLPLKPCKGETLTFYAPNLKLFDIIKGDGVILPLENDFYKIGATYQWDDLSDTITEEAKMELISKLEKLITCPYEIVEQEASVRPTVIDRRPLVGYHPNYQNVWILNGLGTRGVMNAPFVANVLYDAVYQGVTIDKEMDIKRFQKYNNLEK